MINNSFEELYKRFKNNPDNEIAVFLIWPEHFRFIRTAVKQLESKGKNINYFYSTLFIKEEEFKQALKGFDLFPCDILREIPYKVIIMSGSHIETRNIKHPLSPTVFLFHSLASTHTVYSERRFEVFDFLLTPGPYQFEELQSYLKVSPFTHYLAKTGYELTDHLMAIEKPVEENKKTTVLLAPTWGKGEQNSLKKNGRKIIEKLIDNYHVILRPHIVSVKRDKDTIDALISEFKDHKNFDIDFETDSTRSMLKSSVMISDYSGIAFEFALSFLKPVLFLEGERKLNNPNWSKYYHTEGVEVTYRNRIGYIIEDSNEIKNFVDRTVKERELWEHKIKTIRTELIYNIGNAGAVAADQIEKIISGQVESFVRIN